MDEEIIRFYKDWTQRERIKQEPEFRDWAKPATVIKLIFEQWILYGSNWVRDGTLAFLHMFRGNPLEFKLNPTE